MIDIFRKQQNILFVCPTLSSGTRERMLLRDILLLKEIGHNVFLYCVKDSFIDVESKRYGVDCLYHDGKVSSSILSWFKLGKLKGYVNRLDINVVHCYSLQYLWPLAFFLRNKPLIPLFFTLNHEIKKFYKQFWYRPLASRIDLIFLPVREMIESIQGHLEVPLRKIYFSGFGLNKEAMNNMRKDLDDMVWNLACWVNDDETEIDEISVILDTLWALSQSSRIDKPLHLHIYSSRPWENSLIYERLQAKIDEYKLGHLISLRCAKDIVEITSDIWLSYSSKTPLEDFTLVAMLKGMPMIAPRNATTLEIKRIYGNVCATYKYLDARELKDCLTWMIREYESCELSCKKSTSELWLEHGQEGYKYNLYSTYQKHINKRRRFYA